MANWHAYQNLRGSILLFEFRLDFSNPVLGYEFSCVSCAKAFCIWSEPSTAELAIFEQNLTRVF
jgi:hypothetical protein